MCHLFHIRLVFLTYRSAYCEERKLKGEIFSYQAEYCTETVTRWKNKPSPFSLDVSFTFWFVSWLSHQVHYFSLATKSFKWVTQGSTIFISYRQFSLWELKTVFYLDYLHSCMICLSPDPVCCIIYSSIWLCVIISLRVILSNYVPNLSITRKIILSRIEKWLNSLLDHSCKTKFFLLLKPKSNCSGLEINAERNVNTA